MKIIFITSCIHCPHSDVDPFSKLKDYCSLAKRRLRKLYFPKWCPLPDYGKIMHKIGKLIKG